MWDRRTFIVVFLKVLQVIGKIQEVLVRTGDTIILNCTCISQINGNWVGPNRSSSKTISFNEEKLIPYTEGFRVNKKLNISNINVVGSYENRTCNLVITKFSTDDEGKYKCQYVENNITNSRVYKVLLQNPPDVSINTQESEKTITLKCHASGDPGSYKFAKWEHQSEFGKHIRYIGNTRNGTLVLEKHNYQNSGIYKCSVKNGIPDMNGELYQKELVMVNYKGPPVFVSNNSKTWFAQYHEDAKIIVKVFSSSNITRGRILKIEKGHKEEQAFKSIRSFIQSTCRESLSFYNVSVLVECIELTFELAMPGSDDLRNYTVEVCNTYNCSSFEVTVVSAKLVDIKHHFLGWIISAIMIILAVISGGLVFAVVKLRGKEKQSHDIRPSDIEMDIHGASVDNRLYLSTDFHQSHSTRNQPELMEMNIPTTGLNQTISALSSHYQEERSEEQNVRDANRIIPTQHSESSLNYADVIFEAGPKASISIIHGHEDRTIYSEIDLLHLRNAIPSSSGSDKDDFMYVDGIENYHKKD